MGIAVDGAGNSCVTGFTDSANFPTQNGWDKTYNDDHGDFDAFVAKFSAEGSLLWSTYLGGRDEDEGNGIAVDGSGNTYVVGVTLSSNFPRKNGWDVTLGWEDAFVTKFSADGSLLWSTFLGGNDGEDGLGIAVDAAGDAYVTGYTTSANFPTQNGWDKTYNGSNDAFVAKFGTGGSLLWSTYLGGRGPEWGYGIAVDGAGNAYVTGETSSLNFPTRNGWDTTYNGSGGGYGDAFVAKFREDGSFLWSTYLGGNDQEVGQGIAVDGVGNAYVTGWTDSHNFPAFSGWDTTYNGGKYLGDAFVAKLAYAPRTLNVQSSPMTGVSITGTVRGKTNYNHVLDFAHSVELTTLTKDPKSNAFVRWDLNGTHKSCGDPTLKFSIRRDSTAVARYKPFRSLRITGPTIVNESSRVTYACKLYCKDGTAYIITPGAKWLDNSAYARFEKAGCLRTYAVPSSKRVRLSATYAGRTCYLYITIRNTR